MHKQKNVSRSDRTDFRSLFEAAQDGMMILNSAAQILEFNKANLEILDLKEDSLEGNIFTKLPIIASKSELSVLQDHLSKNTPQRGELDIKTARGKNTTTVEYTFTPNILKGKHLLILRDITDRKLEEKGREHFLSIASHELKSPLASIKAYTEIIKRFYTDKDDKIKSYLDKLNERVDTLNKRINDLLDITRIRQRRLEFIPELFDFDELVSNVIREEQFSTNTHRLVLVGKVEHDIVADPTRISQVIINLVRNAIKYSPIAHVVNITVERKGRGVNVSVSDKGMGIPLRDQRRIFDLFYRRYEKNGGTQGLGVGLFISSVIVSQHGGSMSVRSKVGKGATFSFWLPFRPEINAKATVSLNI